MDRRCAVSEIRCNAEMRVKPPGRAPNTVNEVQGVIMHMEATPKEKEAEAATAHG